MVDFVRVGGVKPEADGTFTVYIHLTKIITELEAEIMSRWLETVVNGAMDSAERMTVTMTDNVVDQLRDHLADVHKGSCSRHGTTCTCHYDDRSEELMREVAARIEVALEALTENNEMSCRRALYALTAPRPEHG